MKVRIERLPVRVRRSITQVIAAGLAGCLLLTAGCASKSTSSSSPAGTSGVVIDRSTIKTDDLTTYFPREINGFRLVGDPLSDQRVDGDMVHAQYLARVGDSATTGATAPSADTDAGDGTTGTSDSTGENDNESSEGGEELPSVGDITIYVSLYRTSTEASLDTAKLVFGRNGSTSTPADYQGLWCVDDLVLETDGDAGTLSNSPNLVRATDESSTPADGTTPADQGSDPNGSGNEIDPDSGAADRSVPSPAVPQALQPGCLQHDTKAGLGFTTIADSDWTNGSSPQRVKDFSVTFWRFVTGLQSK